MDITFIKIRFVTHICGVMFFEKRCHCSHHPAVAHHGSTVDPEELRTATRQELLLFKEPTEIKVGKNLFVRCVDRSHIITEETLRKLQQTAA